jgi:hypothetical protein
VRPTEHAKAALRERSVLLVTIVVAPTLVTIGICMACKYQDSHWVNRSGAAIVAVQAIAAATEFSRRGRLHKLRRRFVDAPGERGLATPSGELSRSGSQKHAESMAMLETEIARAEREAFAIVMLLAGAGEVLHGFGDLIVESIWR